MKGPRDIPSAAERGGASSAVPADDVLQFAKVTTTSLSNVTGATLYNVEGPVDRASGMDTYGGIGLVVRPLEPSVVQGRETHAEMLCVRTADGLVPVSGRDLRLNQAFPQPAPGDVVLVGYGSNFVKLSADGKVSIVTTGDATPNGPLVQMQLNPDGWAVIGEWGKVSFDTGGLHVQHHTGARVDLGGVGGVPLLDDLGLTSYVTMAAAIARLEATTITLGPSLPVGPFAAEPIVKSVRTEALLTSLSIAARAEAAALTALETIPTNSPASTALLAAIAAWAGPTGLATLIDAALVPGSPTSIRSESTSAS